MITLKLLILVKLIFPNNIKNISKIIELQAIRALQAAFGRLLKDGRRPSAAAHPLGVLYSTGLPVIRLFSIFV